MAAAAAAAVGSTFSHAIHAPKCTISHSKTCPISEHSFLRVSQPLRSTIHLLSSSLELFPSLLSPVAASRRGLAVSAAAAGVEQEASVEAEQAVEEVVAVEEEQAAIVEQVAGGDGDILSSETKLYFGNLPYSIDSSELARILQDYAVPELIEVIYDRESGRSKGFGFVTMSSIEDATKVVENLDGMEFMGRPLRVNFANKPREKVPLYPETEHKLFVGNLSWSVTADTLTEEFQKFGNVVGTRVVYDGETGKSRGYGFVSFSAREEMEAAIEGADQQELDGRTMRVSVAEGRKQRNA